MMIDYSYKLSYRHLISSRIRASRSHESLLSVCSSNMQTIQLDSSDSISIKKLHSSLFGHDHCFSVTTQHGCKYYSCRNSTERDQWIKCIRKTLRPMEEHTKRKDESLSLCIQEMKKVTVKKRCFCEILLDKKLYARTSVSEKTDTYFWGENFQFNNLNDTREISIDIYREADRKKKKDKNVLIGSVQISVDELKGYGIVDRWFTATAPSISQNNSILMRQRSLDSKADFSPLIRVTAHYEEIEILPNNSYERLVRYVEQNYMKIISTFEPRITKVKDKELLASCLVRVMRKCNKSADFLAKVVLAEIRKSSNAHLTLRGNSVASKAMEKFMHLVGERYLHDTLSQFVTSIIENVDLDFEVDPTRLINPNNSLDKHQDNLKHYVDVALCKIFASLSYFPNELRQVFASMRDHLKEENKSDLVVTLMSACVFLRFICPAILSPSMHGLAKKLPGMKTRRNLTLVAKVIQNLANFSHFGTKEDYMIFFNSVVDSYMGSMRMFLDQISTNAKNADNDQLYFESDVEIGKYLSILHSLLERLFNDVKEDEDNIKDPDLKSILDDIRHELDYGIKPITQITSPTECGNRQGYPTVRSVYDNVEDDDLDKQDQNANSPIRKLVPTPVLTSTPDRNTEDVNNSWNAIVSAAQAVSGQYPDNILPPVDDEDEEESRVERASQVSAMASSGYQSLGGSSPTEPLAFHNPAFNHYRAASRSSSSSDSPKALDSLIYHHQYSHQPKRNEKSANEYENEIMKLRHQLAKAESRLASAEQQLCQQTTEKKDSEAQLKELYDKLSSMERRLKEEKKMMQGNFGQKQQQIDSQEKRLAALDAANARLLSALAHLRTPNSPEGPKLSLDYSASSSC